MGHIVSWVLQKHS